MVPSHKGESEEEAARAGQAEVPTEKGDSAGPAERVVRQENTERREDLASRESQANQADRAEGREVSRERREIREDTDRREDRASGEARAVLEDQDRRSDRELIAELAARDRADVIKNRRRNIAVGFVVLFLVAITLVQSWQNYRLDKARQECLVEFAKDSAEANIIRQDSTSVKYDAIDKLLGILGDLVTNSDPADSQLEQQEQLQTLSAAFREYKVTSAQIEKTRASAPAPPFPTGVCE